MKPRVALIHYWLVGMRGGERVLERIARLYPDADIFTHVVNRDRISAELARREIKTSFISRLPNAVRLYQSYLPLMPMALEHLDLRGYDLVISSESGPAKGVIAPPDALHLCYCHTPMRYLWDHYHAYYEGAGRLSRAVMPAMCHYLRNWDATSARRVDAFAANSRFIQDRIRRAWGMPSDLVHPPVPIDQYSPASEVGGRFLWVGQLITYKRPDLAVDAFTRLGLPLLVVGDGPLAPSLKARAGPSIEFASKLPFDQLRRAYAESRALVFTAEEDFGIVPVEANASGRPVIAYGRGGVRDSIVDGITGMYFPEQSVDALIQAVERFDTWEREFDPAAAVANARRFSPEAFDSAFLASVERAWSGKHLGALP
ncbi:MAG: glycosyl transferase [Sphingomonadales bacterium 32-68-7]|nr:MAG: glycosyl transferase [Sphingomonadales bacterium 12-68-11]OYX09200.1 MAG: glycosyl transferase [Sphingomonadales bacterium 32-68-7]